MSPERATLLHSPGRKPWVNYWNIFMSPKGAALPRRKANARIIVPLLRSSYFCVHVYPGFHFGLCPHCTLGFAGVSCLKALVISLNIHNNTASVVLCNGLLMHLPCTNVRMSGCKIVIAWPILKTSARSVQTSAEVCADYGWSLYRLQLKSPKSTTYLQI